jgi:hypothetical protein
MGIADHPLFVKLARLELPIEHYVIAGSGPMLAHGLERQVHDVDVVARKDAWDRAEALGEVVPAPYGRARAVYLYDGDIEVLDSWFDWTADQLIDDAEIIDGLPFVSLKFTLEWKLEYGNRPADGRDIQMLEEVLRSK